MSVKEAGAAGYPPAAIRAAGYSEEEIISALGELKESGWSPAQASAAGFTIPEIEQVYSEGDVEGLFIDGAKWISTTPRLVQDLVISAIDAYEPDLIASRPEDGVNSEYELHTEVRSFEAVYRDGPDAPPTALQEARREQLPRNTG